MQINYSLLNDKITQALKKEPKISKNYRLGKDLFELINLADKEKMQLIYNKINNVYHQAEELVSQVLLQGGKIVPEHQERKITVVFPDPSKDKSASFFEISQLAEDLGDDNLEKLVIVGFFMSEERMTIIQTYNLINGGLR